MSKLKGNSHIVSYEDHQVIKHENGIGWDILIRMELLTPMMSYMKTTSITKRDVIKLGIDMCRALELCQKYNIIHRDIKPENIFISDSGDFKLGDFGIAKEVEKTQSGLTKTGTQTYMAPEVYKGQPYGSSVDMYSLGVVLYRLLNHNRAPFMPQYPNPISYSDRERALIMRMGGHQFPAPSGVEEGCRLAEIAMKACSFNPENRYSSPTQMREDLEAIMYKEGEGILMFPSGDTIDIKSVHYVSNSKNPNRTQHLRDEQTELMGHDDDATEVMEDVRKRFQSTSANNKNKLLKIIIPVAAVVAIAAVGSLFVLNKKDTSVKTLAVSSVSELNEPIEIKIETPSVTESDYEIIEKRLKAYGAKYYLDRGLNTVVISKSDLGKTAEEIHNTKNMIMGKGEIRLTNTKCDSEYSLTNKDFENSLYEYDENNGENKLILIADESGKDKLEKLTGQIMESDSEELILTVDENIRLSVECSKVIEDGRITVTEKNGEKNKLLALFGDSFVMKAYAEEVRLSGNYMKLIVSFINDGVLSSEYEIYIDEKYGLSIPEKTPDLIQEPTIEPTIEPTVVPTEEPVQQVTEQPVYTNEPAKTKTPAPKPTKVPAPNPTKAPAPKSTKAPAPAPTTAPAQPEKDNSAQMPEVYIDFD